ncbi:MAG: SPFH domain-containing protein [Anaerolineae bacterium]
MVTSRIKWIAMAVCMIPGVGICIAIASLFPQVVWAFVIGVVMAIAVPIVLISACFIVIPPSSARVVRDEMGRVTKVLGPGWHIVIPLVERLSESFSLCWQAMAVEDAFILDAERVEMESRLKILYVVDPRVMRVEWRQDILDSLHADMKMWQNYLRGIVWEQLQLVLAHQPADEWMKVAGRHALRAWLMEQINMRVAGTGIRVQDIQVFWLAPAPAVRQFYMDARRRAVTATSWATVLKLLQQEGLADLREDVQQIRDLAMADALAGRNALTLHMGPMLGWYMPPGNGNGHGGGASRTDMPAGVSIPPERQRRPPD